MAWMWSDELAGTLKDHEELGARLPESWTTRPAAFVVTADEAPETIARRVLGIPADRAETGADSAR